MENPAYHAILARFFRSFDGVDYDIHHVFTEDDLRRVTHADVLNYFKFRCFGTPNPDYRDRNLRVAIRVSTAYFWKKGISKFFCNAGVNNKTQGPMITEFMNRIKRMEVRGKGQLSKARVPFKYQDFMHLIQMLKNNVGGVANDIKKYGIPAMLCFQFSLICRFDDATQMLSANLQYNDRFPQHALKARLVWSKNVNEQRDAPWQTLIGSISTTFCVFINVGIWLELHLSTTPGANLSPYLFGFSHDNEIPSGGDRAKMRARHILTPIFKSPFYREQCVGTHSIRKFAATHCRNCSISKDDVDSRGRWKNSGRTADRYEDPTLPFVDIKACLALCQGDPCTYVPKAGCITPDFVCLHVSPHIEAKYGRTVATVLGNAIAWTIFSSNADMVPAVLRNRVLAAYNVLPEKLPDGENPISRKRLLLTGDVNNFTLTEIDELEGGAMGVDVAQGGVAQNNGIAGAGAIGIGQGGLQHFVMMITAQNRAMQRSIDDIAAEFRAYRETNDVRLNLFQRTLTTFVNQMNRRPHLMLQAAQAAANAAVPQHNLAQPQQAAPQNIVNDAALLPSLSPGPKTLHILWEEWENGIGGRKPASQFTEHESGQRRTKSTFSRRKAFWNLVCHLIRRGHSADDSINRIYGVYGPNLGVNKIIDRIVRDRKNNTFHVSLT
jgi:hypothetical protein